MADGQAIEKLFAKIPELHVLVNAAGVIRRVRVNLALSIVVGALVVVLTTIGLIGLAAIAIGVLVTFPYATFVGAYLVGRYAQLTDRPTLRAEAIDR